MKTFPRVVVFLGVLVLAALNISVYWNNRLYLKAMKTEDKRARIALLERSNAVCPINELVFYEIGKAYFGLGLEELEQPQRSEQDFRRAVKYLKRSIIINPASPFAHFYLGQAMIRLGAQPSGQEAETLDEFRKAIALGSEDGQISQDVGLLFLSRWPALGASDRDLTLKTLKRVLAKKDPAQANLVMNSWEMNVGDPSVMDKILPADASIYRLFARFLGERSLLLGERQKVLAQAELLDFASARRQHQQAEAALFRARIGEASDRLRDALRLLQGIRFYQTLLGQNLISLDEYTGLLRSIWLDLAKCRIAEGGAFATFEAELREYLALENQPKEISGLEELLRSRGLIEEKPGARFDDMRRLAFELLLYYKQTRYREIIDVGRELSRSVAVIPPDRKKEYAEVLRLIGDSYQKIDYLYDAGDFYRKALELIPRDLETLVRIRQNYDRLNEDRKMREVDAAIESVESAREIVVLPVNLERGEAFTRRLVFRRGKISLDFEFAATGVRPPAGPLIAVNLNGRVIREEFVKEGTLSLAVETDLGENVLQVLSVNCPVSLTKLVWHRLPDVENTPRS
jgi:tetratricopeptide (TPR) repeat protein